MAIFCRARTFRTAPSYFVQTEFHSIYKRVKMRKEVIMVVLAFKFNVFHHFGLSMIVLQQQKSCRQCIGVCVCMCVLVEFPRNLTHASLTKKKNIYFDQCIEAQFFNNTQHNKQSYRKPKTFLLMNECAKRKQKLRAKIELEDVRCFFALFFSRANC